MTASARSWTLESFLDALILDLDKAQDTLALKGVTRRLSYTVRDVGVDLYVAPQYDGGDLRFAVAKPDDRQASKISFNLGSITDTQIRETAREPMGADDVSIDAVEDLEPDVRESLKKVGVRSASDLERMRRRQVDVEAVIADKSDGRAHASYDDLAAKINRARRRDRPPRVRGMSAREGARHVALALTGEDLQIDAPQPGYPQAFLNDAPLEVVELGADRLVLRGPRALLRPGRNTLKAALDPETVLSLNLTLGEAAP
ncbi:MAG: hypothetical protein RKE49_00060 [Oceanicaulis sp.]